MSAPSFLDFVQGTTGPSTPGAGRLALYPKTDGLWYSKNDAGVEAAVGGVSGITELTGSVLAGPGSGSVASTVAGALTDFPLFGRLGIGAAADANHLLTINGGTLTADKHLIDAAVTWNNAAVTFTGFSVDVTNSASNVLSKFVDFKVGGSSRFSVLPTGPSSGLCTINVGPNIVITSGGTYGLIHANGAANHLWFHPSGSIGVRNALTGLQHFTMAANAGLSWTEFGDNFYGAIIDTSMFRDDVGVVAQRAGLIAQEYRLCNTWTSATNFERLDLDWTANECRIWTEKGSGGGTARPLVIGADATELLRFDVGSKIGAFGATPVTKPTVSGSRADPEAALASVLTALANLGWITNSSTA